MAKVTVQVVGGSLKQMEKNTVQDIMTELGLTNYGATVNGDAVQNNYELSDFEFVTLAPQVKGAAKKAATKTKTVLKKASAKK
jgi:sulfur carrier protein ThiS